MRREIFGYQIKNGKAYVDKEKAAKVKKLYDGYINGLALRTAALDAGIDTFHGSAGRMLNNEKYLGTDYYPAIIDEETFKTVQEIRENRAKQLGRVFETKEDLPIISPTKFHFKSKEVMFEDPFRQAEYAFSMIESEWF